MSVAYRSKDEEFMRNLRRAVQRGMRDMDDEDRDKAWLYMKRRVLMDDLHKYAIQKLDAREPVQMGHGNLAGDVLVLTLRPLSISQEGKELAETIVRAGKFKDVYYTALYKTPTAFKSKKLIYQEILDAEINFLKPKIILSFGEVLPVGMHEIGEYMGRPVMQTHLLSSVIQETDEAARQKLKDEIWRDVKAIRVHYKK